MDKILLIEDDELMVRMYQRVFTLEGFTAEIATDGEDGYNKAKILKPNLILLDIMMPKLNGLQTLEKLKNDPETKNYPVMMLTNLANKADAESAIQMGAVKYLIKSNIDPQEVIKLVKEFLQTHRS